MAGTKKNDRKTSGSGGKRPNSGRKPAYMLAETQVKNMLRAARKRAKAEDKEIDDILLDIIYDLENSSTRDKLAAIKLFKEFTMQKSTEKNINVKNVDGPAIGLPESRPDPISVPQKPEEKKRDILNIH